LKRVAEEWQQGLKKEQERYKALKAHAEEKLELANKVSSGAEGGRAGSVKSGQM
jgi:hypothetical protein